MIGFRKLMSFLVLTMACSHSHAGQLDEARSCVQHPERLKRLACFDEVFGTPFAAQPAGAVVMATQPERWRQAFAQASDSDTAIYRDTGRAAGLLVTVPALGARPPRPLLVLQCSNNITELSVMLPEVLSAERVRIGLAGMTETSWRVRDDGFVVSAGRGLPAIQTVKTMLPERDIRLQASRPELNDLMFDLEGFADAIRPLREACGW